MVLYPAAITRDGRGFVFRFRDLPQASAIAQTYTHARLQAADALAVACARLVMRGTVPPEPSAPHEGELLVAVPPSTLTNHVLQSLGRATRATSDTLDWLNRAAPVESLRRSDAMRAARHQRADMAQLYEQLARAEVTRVELVRTIERALGAAAEVAPAVAISPALLASAIEALDQLDAHAERVDGLITDLGALGQPEPASTP